MSVHVELQTRSEFFCGEVEDVEIRRLIDDEGYPSELWVTLNGLNRTSKAQVYIEPRYIKVNGKSFDMEALTWTFST